MFGYTSNNAEIINEFTPMVMTGYSHLKWITALQEPDANTMIGYVNFTYDKPKKQT